GPPAEQVDPGPVVNLLRPVDAQGHGHIELLKLRRPFPIHQEAVGGDRQAEPGPESAFEFAEPAAQPAEPLLADQGGLAAVEEDEELPDLVSPDVLCKADEELSLDGFRQDRWLRVHVGVAEPVTVST